MNRITVAIKKMEQQIAERISSGKVTQKQVDKTHAELDMTFEEYARFQTLKSAVAGSKLTVEEANTIYAILGEGGPERFNKSDVAIKAVLTRVFAELLEKQLAACS